MDLEMCYFILLKTETTLSFPPKLYFIFSSSEPQNSFGKIVISHEEHNFVKRQDPSFKATCLTCIREGERTRALPPLKHGWALSPFKPLEVRGEV